MTELLKNGHAGLVECEDVQEDYKAWYIPHFSVRHLKNKLRVVFDAIATYDNVSLNDCLLPSHIDDLLGILCRFRERSVAVTCDIEKMFYNFR